MKKIAISISVFLILILSGCSNNQSAAVTKDFKKDTKQVYTILVDYMKNGKSMDESKQRQIDYYRSDFSTKMDTLSDEDRKLFIHISTMDTIRQRYDIQDKNSTKKQEIMQSFLDEEKQIIDIIK